MSFELLKSVENRLKTGLAQAKFPIPYSDPVEYKAPGFFLGAVPPRRRGEKNDTEDPGDFPFIVNRLVGLDDTTEDSLITVKTIVGIYTLGSPTHGEEEIFNLVSRIRRLFLEHLILDQRFELVLPLKSKFGDGDDDDRQPHPYYGGYIWSQWRIPAIHPLLSVEEETRIYGSGL